MIPMVESSERGPQRRKRENGESGEGERPGGRASRRKSRCNQNA